MYALVRREEDAEDAKDLHVNGITAPIEDGNGVVQDDSNVIELVTLSEDSEHDDLVASGSIPSVSSTSQLTEHDQTKYTQAKQSLKGLTLMLVASLCFSMMALLVSAVSETGVPTFELVFFRSIIGLVLSLGYLLLSRSTIIGEPKHRPLLILRGVLGTISQACYYFSLSKLLLADAVVLSFLAPVFTTLVAYAVLKEALVSLDFIGAALSIAGVIMIARPPFLFGSEVPAGDVSGYTRWLAVGSAIVSSFFSALAYVSALLLVSYFSLTGIAMTLPLTLILETPILPKGPYLLMLLGIGVFAWLGQIGLNRGLQLERAGAAASVNYVSVVFAFAFQVLLLHKAVNLWTAAGAALICTYAALLFAKKVFALRVSRV